tara:strand:- start:389 stop:679 length:291 start_codon:yes stop_codon:yes gene_type:complete
MRKIYKNLTQDQIKRKVIFSSDLSIDHTDLDPHEVFKHEIDIVDPCNEHCKCNGRENFNSNIYGKYNSMANIKIRRLLNDKDFNGSPYYNYNVVRR